MNNISIDFSKITDKAKPMHGIGQPPRDGISDRFHNYLKQAGIPYSRLHDVGHWLGGGLYVDIPNLFRDFDADENDPASYDFAFTDAIIKNLMDVGCEPYFRLGVTIENKHRLKAYRIFPPKDPAKWARICEHVIRHYNEGWADGHHYNITYWEIWNEPDDCDNINCGSMWHGTPEQFFELYSVAAKHLKSCFGDSIKIGGYGHCGLYAYDRDPELKGIPREPHEFRAFTLNFSHDFFKYINETGAPMDFFSWHVYDNCDPSCEKDFRIIREHAKYARRLLDHYGFPNAEHHVNEWNLYTHVTKRDDPQACAKTLSFMLMMQDTTTDVMCYYDGNVGYTAYGGLINPDKGYPYRNYYAFMMFNSLYKLGNLAYTKLDNDNIFAKAAVDEKRAAIVITNPNGEPVDVKLDLVGFNASEIQVLRVDEENRYTFTGEEIVNGTLTLPEYGCVELKLFDLT